MGFRRAPLPRRLRLLARNGRDGVPPLFWITCALVGLACGTQKAVTSGGGQAGGGASEADLAAGDVACLRFLEESEVAFVRPEAPVRGIRTAVVVKGALGGVRLVPRGRAPALMDCELARALVEAAPTIREAGIRKLIFSGAYNYRNRRRSSRLSAHAHGLAIDVHEFDGPVGRLSVQRDFEAGRGRWRGIVTREGDIDGCIGTPRGPVGRRLRRLVCELKHHSAFRVVITPDDNADHRDHVHFEAFPDAVARVSRVMGRF